MKTQLLFPWSPLSALCCLFAAAAVGGEPIDNADGMRGRFRLGYGAQVIHVAAAMAEDRAEIADLVACGADPDARDAGG